MLHVLSMATSCTVSCFRTVSATLDTDFSSVALITVACSVTACAVSDFTVIVVTEAFDCDVFDLRCFVNCILSGPLAFTALLCSAAGLAIFATRTS